MKLLESLKPTKNILVKDLVATAGVDVSRWAYSKNGRVKTPASNPAYCYEWAFVQRGQVVVVNLWHEVLKERTGEIFCDLNLREWSEKMRRSLSLRPSQRSAGSRRALSMDEKLLYAYENQIPVRVIVGEGSRRNIDDAESSKASVMKYRLLDSLVWSVQKYDYLTGKCRLSRGGNPIFVDQFSSENENPARQRGVTRRVWERDQRIRDIALIRAQGICEFCRNPGFKTTKGTIYLETHHIIPLSEGGADSKRNVVAICPNDHRRAHHSEHRNKMRDKMLTMLAKKYSK